MNDVTLDIYIISRLTHGFYARELAKLGITMAQFPYIMAIIEKDGISQEKLSKLLRMGKSTTATVVKQLVDKQLVTREVDAADRRNFKLHASAEAIALKPLIVSVVERCNRLITGEMSTPERFSAMLSEVRSNAELKLGSGGTEI
ncbi:MAG: MarR family transcriptional regulator [Lentisphaeria bacterium]|nr:MarR family transcriptional regulator [Lentisphaeria bacterium]